MEYNITDVLSIAARDGNSIRPYLYVDPLQGKHIPVTPSKSIELFTKLADIVSQRYSGEKILVIGFAETATAIGAAISWYAPNVSFCMSTTREDVRDSGYIRFTESHSHATDQRLSDKGLEKCLKQVDRVVFAEDEITTGNTIEKCIKQLEPYGVKFGMVSILNSMSEKRLCHFDSKDIPVDYLFHIHSDPEAPVCNYEVPFSADTSESSVVVKTLTIGDRWDIRVAEAVETAKDKLGVFIQDVSLQVDKAPRVLVLGTEEFMFPAMMLGRELEKSCNVKFHATSRSPILVSADTGYPLKNRSILDSLYEAGRSTIIYNLDKYDKVIIVTDAADPNPLGVNSLVNALVRFGNDDITLVIWRH